MAGAAVSTCLRDRSGQNSRLWLTSQLWESLVVARGPPSAVPSLDSLAGRWEIIISAQQTVDYYFADSFLKWKISFRQLGIFTPPPFTSNDLPREEEVRK